MATTDEILEGLLSAQASVGYSPKSASAIREQAEGDYASMYDRLRMTAQQGQEYQDLLLQQQLKGIGRSYTQARTESERNYKNLYSQTDRQMLSRGMQRSSYAAQTLANIGLEGEKAQKELWERQVSDEEDIGQQRTMLARQLAETLAGYSEQQAQDVLARIRELEDKEYDRSMQAASMQASLSAQIYGFLYQAERDKAADAQWQQSFDYQAERDRISDERWQQTFDAQYGNKSSGSSGSYTPTKKPTTQPTNDTSGYNNFMNDMNGSTNLKFAAPKETPPAKTFKAAVMTYDDAPKMTINEKKSVNGISNTYEKIK